MKCGRCGTVYIGRTGKFWCNTCEASAICGKAGPEWPNGIRQQCLREPEHRGGCSPMHFRVFDESKIEAYSFDRWDHERGCPR